MDLLPQERADRARFVLVVQPVDDERPDGVRIRRLLKDLGRRHGLRVLDVAERLEPVNLTPHEAPRDK